MSLTQADRDLLKIFYKGLARDNERMRDPKTDYIEMIMLYENTYNTVRFWARRCPEEFGELAAQMEAERHQMQIQSGMIWSVVAEEVREAEYQERCRSDIVDALARAPKHIRGPKYKRIPRKDW